MENSKSYPSKILLFGEYGILLGSKGLAIPYPAFSGKLERSASNDNSDVRSAAIESNLQIRELFEYLNNNPNEFEFIDLQSFAIDLDNGIWFNSNIPQGYGVGSSAALSAAIFDRYSTKEAQELPTTEIRKMLAAIERFFHGTSSGLDPLVSWTKQPVLISEKEKISLPEPDISFNDETNPGSGIHLFLVDSGMAGTTGGGVEWFLNQYEDWEFRRAVNEVYFPAIDDAVTVLQERNHSQFAMAFETITGFQMQFLNPLIPASLMDHLEYGLFSGQFFLKLCGSGGGGYMLGLANNKQETEKYFSEKKHAIRFI